MLLLKYKYANILLLRTFLHKIIGEQAQPVPLRKLYFNEKLPGCKAQKDLNPAQPHGCEAKSYNWVIFFLAAPQMGASLFTFITRNGKQNLFNGNANDKTSTFPRITL